MIIPIRCFTCGTVVADKWTPFVKEIMEQKNESNKKVDEENSIDIEYIKVTNDGSIKKSIEGKVMDDLGLVRVCCRRHFMTHVDIE